MTHAMQRREMRAQAMQAVAIRLAVWGEADAFADFIDRLEGRARGTRRDAVDWASVDADLAAFGLRAEGAPDAP